MKIVVLTGNDRGKARAAMGDALRQDGVEVHVVYGKADRPRLPDFEEGDLLVVDTRFLPHAAQYRAIAEAKRAGADVFMGRAGSAFLRDLNARRPARS
jgi:hypothetical protein